MVDSAIKRIRWFTLGLYGCVLLCVLAGRQHAEIAESCRQVEPLYIAWHLMGLESEQLDRDLVPDWVDEEGEMYQEYVWDDESAPGWEFGSIYKGRPLLESLGGYSLVSHHWAYFRTSITGLGEVAWGWPGRGDKDHQRMIDRTNSERWDLSLPALEDAGALDWDRVRGEPIFLVIEAIKSGDMLASYRMQFQNGTIEFDSNDKEPWWCGEMLVGSPENDDWLRGLKNRADLAALIRTAARSHNIYSDDPVECYSGLRALLGDESLRLPVLNVKTRIPLAVTCLALFAAFYAVMYAAGLRIVARAGLEDAKELWLVADAFARHPLRWVEYPTIWFERALAFAIYFGGGLAAPATGIVALSSSQSFPYQLEYQIPLVAATSISAAYSVVCCMHLLTISKTIASVRRD